MFGWDAPDGSGRLAVPLPGPQDVPCPAPAGCTRPQPPQKHRLNPSQTILVAALQAARRSGDSWQSLRIEGAPHVTDRALLGCGAKAAQLRELALVGLPGVSVRGLTAFMLCTELTTLELSDLPAFDAAEVTVRR